MEPEAQQEPKCGFDPIFSDDADALSERFSKLWVTAHVMFCKLVST